MQTTKIFAAALLGISSVLMAQTSVAVKANMLFQTGSPSWKNITSTATNAYNEKGKNNAGYNVGLSLKVPFMNSLFIMPELYYTSFKSEFTEPVDNVTIQAKNSRIDLPVLLGYNLLGDNFGVFVGPVASYNFAAKDENFEFDGGFVQRAAKEFTVGYQFGAQASISKIILNARYEGAFTKDQRDFIENVADSGSYIKYDNRPSLFIVGLGYKF